MKYSEYKDSRSTWMGSIPSHWKLERAKWSFTLRNERGNAEPVLLAATQKYGMYPQDLIEGVVKVAEGTDVQQFRTVHKDDFVISLRSFQGGFERSDYEGVCSPAYQVFYANNRWDTNYLKFLFKNELFIDAMNALTVGIREGRNIKYEDFANSVLAIPPISEQRSIAAFLDSKIAHIDSVIAEAKASIEEYKAWKASIIYEAVTKGLDPDVEMKDSGIEWIGWIPMHWKRCKIKQVADAYNGDRSSNYPSGDDIVSEGVPFITSNNLGAITLSTENGKNKYITEEKYSSLRGAKLQLNDIVFCLRGSVGKCSINKQYDCGTIASSLVVFRANRINPDYLNYVLQNRVITEMALTTAIGIGSLNLSAENIMGFPIAIPPVDEQRDISIYLDNKCKAIESLIAEKESLIVDLETYKKSLIFEAATGKRRVY